MGGGTVQIKVELPIIRGESVEFRWTQSQPNPYQRVNSFNFRYESIELASFSPKLFFEIFLGLQLRVFAAYSEPVTIQFPIPIPRSTVDYWTAFHDAAHVTIAPIADTVTYSPWSGLPRIVTTKRKAAVFFGGGKDSTLAACLATEIEGPDQVVLVQFVGPLRPDPVHATRLEQRQQNLMLQPTANRLGVASQRVWTDFQAQFLPAGYHLRPNLELYTLGALPALLTWGIEWCTFSIPWTLYPTEQKSDGSTKIHYERSRPEELANLSRHYEHALGHPITVTNITFPLAAHLTYQLLAERYPEAAQEITSCTLGEVDERWCYRCAKCTGIMIWSLACGRPLASFDYDYFLSESPFIQRVVAHAQTGLELTATGNAPWHPYISTQRGFDLVCSMVRNIDASVILPDLSVDALTNLALLQTLYGNRDFPEYNKVPIQPLEMLDPKIAAWLRPIIEQHLQMIETLPGEGLAKSPKRFYQFDGSFTPRTSSVDHLHCTAPDKKELEKSDPGN